MKKTCLILLGGVLLLASSAEAGTCQFRVDPTNVVFGTYSVFGSGSLSTTSSYEIRCTPQTEGILTFTTGSNASTYFPRYMANGADLIAYNLYNDAANSTVLGDNTGGTTAHILFNGTPKDKDFVGTIYASTPQGSNAAPGTYTDTVTAVLSWDNFARSTSVTFTVTTIVQAECEVTTIPVSFGNYDPVGAHLSSPLDATGRIDVYCTKGTLATVSLGNGQNFAGGTRRMDGPPTSFLNYQLYRDAARASIWSTAPNTRSGTSTSRLTPIAGGLTVYGRIPGGQDPLAGVHNDTVQATVNY